MKRRIVRNQKKRNTKEVPLVKGIESINSDEEIKRGIAVVETADNRIYVVTEGTPVEVVGLLEFGKSIFVDVDWEEDDE